MSVYSLEYLQARALDYADMAGSGFPDSDRVRDYINDGLGEVHEMLAHHDYLRSVASITLVAGTEEYALPADFYKCSRVWLLTSGRRHMVDRFSLSQLDGLKTTGPIAAGSVEMWYVPRFSRLVQQSDAVFYDLPNGWETFAALHAAIQLLNREESDPQALMAERERVKQRIMVHVEPRDAGIPDEVEDHYNRWGRSFNDSQSATLRYRVMGSKIHFVDFGEEV